VGCESIHEQSAIRSDLCRISKLLSDSGETADGDVCRVSEQIQELFSSLGVAARFDLIHSLAGVCKPTVRQLAAYVLQSDPSPLVRHEAAFILGCVGGNQELQVVRHALEADPSFLVRHEAAMAIAEIGGSGELPLLTKGMLDVSEEVVVSCEVAIARITQRLSAAGSPVGWDWS
jgi:HEAT repeat protein